MRLKPLKVVLIPLALIIVVFLALFIHTGGGLIELIDNWRKGDPPIPSAIEVIMPADATVEATTSTGTITIKSGKGLKRYYSWNGVTRSVVMWPRAKRWYGSFGVYYPGPGSHWFPKHGGISRGVLGEGQQHFDTYEEALFWLSKQGPDCVYNDHGLGVCFSMNLDREQLNVHMWQIYIGGDIKSEHQEDDFHFTTAKIFGRTLEKEEIDRIYGWRKNKIYHTGGRKPTALKGSNNAAIKTSWDNL